MNGAYASDEVLIGLEQRSAHYGLLLFFLSIEA